MKRIILAVEVPDDGRIANVTVLSKSGISVITDFEILTPPTDEEIDKIAETFSLRISDDGLDYFDADAYESIKQSINNLINKILNQ